MEQQLAVCTAQANQLTAGMSSAISKLSHLHLTVRLVAHNKRRLVTTVDSTHRDAKAHSKYRPGRSSLHTEEGGLEHLPQVGCPLQLEGVPRRVFEILSLAVPHLQHLSLLGHCSDAALYAFALSCPVLHSLTVEASSVPIKAFRNLHIHFPELTHFRISKRGAYGNNLQASTLASFAEIGPCTSMSNLTLDFGPKVEIFCNEEQWQLLPPSVTELYSTCRLRGLRRAPLLLASLQLLDVLESPFDNLLELLRHAPSLISLNVKQKQSINFYTNSLYNSDGSTAGDADHLRERLYALAINCPAFMIHGRSFNVLAVTSWLRPLVSCRILTIEVAMLDPTPVDCLHRIAFAFPKLQIFKLIYMAPLYVPNAEPTSLYPRCLIPVLGCRSLKQLFLQMQFPWTTSVLSAFCLDLPALEKLKCIRCKGLDCLELEQGLKLIRPKFAVDVY